MAFVLLALVSSITPHCSICPLLWHMMQNDNAASAAALDDGTFCVEWLSGSGIAIP